MTGAVLRVVAAAGASSRMGATKALLDLGGRSALERIAALDLPGFRLVTVVVVGHDGERVAAEARRLGLAVAPNENWPAGQTGSVKRGLAAPAARDCERFLLHPVDLPLVAQASYEALARILAEAAPEDVVATSVGRRRGHPLVFGPAIRRAILAAGDDDSIREVLRAADPVFRHAEVPDPWVRRDLDHPEDLAAARAYLAGSGESGSP